MPPFAFVHAADLHLDSPFIGIGKLPDEHGPVIEMLREATFKAFEAVVQVCIDRKADFLLVAGDVYDGADRSLRAQLRFRDTLQRLADRGIRAYVVHGNHDPLDGWSHALKMPGSVHVFGDQLESAVFTKDGVAIARIHGISYPIRTIDDDFGRAMRREGNEPFQIGLLHCNVGDDSRHDPYAPRSIAELVEANLDYWALGHIHQRITLRASEPFIGYPGNTQGRHINEPGPRGCLFVQVAGSGTLAAPPEFVPTEQVRWETCGVDVAGMDTIDDLLSAIEDRMEALSQESHGRPVVARLVVEGRGALHRELARPESLDTLQHDARSRGAQRTPFIWIERLVLNTRPEINLESRRAGQDFLGELLQLFDEERRNPDAKDGLGEALANLYQHHMGRKYLDLETPNANLLRELLDEAEIRCADLLAEDD